MRAYYYDNIEGDQRLAHDSGEDVTPERLAELGLIYLAIPIEGRSREEWEKDIDEVAKEREYKNRDVINVSKAGLGELYETKIKGFFHEHLHEDEEIRFIMDGSGFFDVKTPPPEEKWIRVFLTKGDLLVLPPGIYHRFTLDEGNTIQALRLFKDEPKWTPYNRSEEVDSNPHRKAWLDKTIKA
ncbi:1,2-dihydroxy-3-keto-5-methylthiopentene dioxygenase [Mrakia frigida]|uniref:acireductone dioxygenase (Ni2+-requiring) n=1 Tax=Mrakia frigida TaxID=29902 RepID=UPI003FCBF58C